MSRKISGFCSLTSTHNPVFSSPTHILRGKHGHQPLQKAQCETQAESELILKSKQPFVRSLEELVTRPWCAVCQWDPGHPLNTSQCGIPWLWDEPLHPNSYFSFNLFNLTLFYLFLTPGTQWVGDLINLALQGFPSQFWGLPQNPYHPKYQGRHVNESLIKSRIDQQAAAIQTNSRLNFIFQQRSIFSPHRICNQWTTEELCWCRGSLQWNSMWNNHKPSNWYYSSWKVMQVSKHKQITLDFFLNFLGLNTTFYI